MWIDVVENAFLRAIKKLAPLIMRSHTIVLPEPCPVSHFARLEVVPCDVDVPTAWPLPWLGDPVFLGHESLPAIRIANAFVVFVEMDGGLTGLLCLEHHCDRCRIKLLPVSDMFGQLSVMRTQLIWS